MSEKDSRPNRFLGVLAYLWVLVFIPYVVWPKNEFLRFHIRQGLVLFIAEIIFTLVWLVPFIGWLIGFFGYFFCLIFSLKGIFSVLTNQYWKIPWLNKFAKRIKS